jgi:hypothetical protein
MGCDVAGDLSDGTQMQRGEGDLRELYACASPMVMGKIERKIRVKMLIDSGSEMNVMS